MHKNQHVKRNNKFWQNKINIVLKRDISDGGDDKSAERNKIYVLMGN